MSRFQRADGPPVWGRRSAPSRQRQEQSMTWWKNGPPGIQSTTDSDLSYGDIVHHLVSAAMRDGTTSQSYICNKLQELQSPLSDLIAALETELHCIIRIQKEGDEYYFIDDNSFLEFHTARTGVDRVVFASSNLEKFEAVKKILRTHLKPPNTKLGQIYMLQSSHGYHLAHLGVAGSPLISENYSPQVNDDYKHVVADLNSSNPCGRLVVFSGIPGCGKTWMLRSILCEVPDARFVLVPPHLISQLGSPELLPDLKTAVEEHTGPLILIAEDADDCLLPRMGDNMSTIQGMLNASDGILGSLLDVRIIVTTNADKFKMDSAVIRPGRLCRHVEVGPLNREQGAQVYKRLTGEDIKMECSKTLAQVYREARLVLEKKEATL